MNPLFSFVASSAMVMPHHYWTSKASDALYPSMVIHPTGHRLAHRPHRMQISSSLIMTAPISESFPPLTRISNSFSISEMSVSLASILSRDTNSIQFSRQMSTQPPQRMHSVPFSSPRGS